MSNYLKLNVTLASACIGLALTIGGAVWSVATRDTDLTNLKNDIGSVKAERRADHEMLTEIQTDLKWIKEALIAKKP